MSWGICSMPEIRMRAMRWKLIGISTTLLACMACARKPEPVAAAEPQAASQSKAGAKAAVTDSSLAIKRGILALDEERVTFRACGTDSEWWVVDQTPDQLTQTLIEEASTAPAELYVEAYGERASADEAQAGEYEAALILEELLYASVAGETRGCAAPPSDFIVSARGNEPFWNAEVRDDSVRWRQPEAPTEIAFGAPQTQDAEGEVHYAASAGEHRLDLMIHAQPCRDSMSGEYFAYTARATLDRKEFTGCARVGR
jgi:uncharacterized membrane protein